MTKKDYFIALLENTHSTYAAIEAHFANTPDQYVIYTDIEILDDFQTLINSKYEKDFNFNDGQLIEIAALIRKYYKDHERNEEQWITNN